MVSYYNYYWCRDIDHIRGDLVCSYIERVVVLGQHIMVIEAEDVGILLRVVVIWVIFYWDGVVRVYSMWVVFYLASVWICDGIVLASKYVALLYKE